MSASLKQLETLHWVVKLGSFQAAANRLHTTQSAVSKRIADLEDDFGRPLFDRSQRAARITAEGERLARRAGELLDLHGRLFSSLAESANVNEEFRLAASELTALTWLPGFLRRVSQAHPTLRVTVEVDHGGRLLERMHAGKYDLAVIPGPMWGKLFVGVPLRTMERCWMAAPGMNTPRRVLSIEELSRYPIATQFTETIHAQLQTAWFNRGGFLSQPTFLAHSIASLGAIVLSGLAVGHLPVKYYNSELLQGRLVRLKISPELPNVKYFAVHRRTNGHHLAASLAAIAKQACNFSPAQG